MNDLLDRRLDEILHPGGWGSSEAYELQVLLLLELRFFPDNRQALMHEYSAFFCPLFPDLGARPLFTLPRLDHADHVALSRLLGAFRQRLSGSTPTITPSMVPQKP